MRSTLLVALCLLTTTVAVVAAPGAAALTCRFNPYQTAISCVHEGRPIVCVGDGVVGVLEQCSSGA